MMLTTPGGKPTFSISLATWRDYVECQFAWQGDMQNILHKPSTVLAALQHNYITCCQRWRHFPGKHNKREVPWDNKCYHIIWLFDGQI
jgi:hypothetical protein